MAKRRKTGNGQTMMDYLSWRNYGNCCGFACGSELYIAGVNTLRTGHHTQVKRGFEHQVFETGSRFFKPGFNPLPDFDETFNYNAALRKMLEKALDEASKVARAEGIRFDKEGARRTLAEKLLQQEYS